MTKFTALVLAAGLAISAGTTASAMSDQETISMGQSMLTGALFNSLRSEGFSTMHLDKLTLNEIVLINSLLSSDGSSNERKGQINLIMDRAAKR